MVLDFKGMVTGLEGSIYLDAHSNSKVNRDESFTWDGDLGH